MVEESGRLLIIVPPLWRASNTRNPTISTRALSNERSSSTNLRGRDETRRCEPGMCGRQQGVGAVSSVGERFLDTEEVISSILIPPTMKSDAMPIAEPSKNTSSRTWGTRRLQDIINTALRHFLDYSLAQRWKRGRDSRSASAGTPRRYGKRGAPDYCQSRHAP